MTKQPEALSVFDTLKLATNRLEWFVDAYPHDIAISKEEFLRPFKEALAQPEQKPVARVLSHEEMAEAAKRYTTPPQRKPLTDDWIRSMCKQDWVFETVKQWVRIAEKAHGIGENK